jgi:hypothetical protein
MKKNEEVIQFTDPFLEQKKLLSNLMRNDSTLIFKGNFEYIFQENIYTEENFNVYRVNKDSYLYFHCEQNSRTETGDFIKSKLYYGLNKEWVPVVVILEKKISDMQSIEKFELSSKGSQLDYFFWNKQQEKLTKGSIAIPPKFQIATPFATTSCLFLGSKKFDPTNRNFYNILTSENNWEFLNIPHMNFVVVERLSASSSEIKIKDKTVKAIHYRVKAMTEDNKINEQPINMFLSKHAHIPYIMDIPGGIKINVKKLQEMENGTE